MDQRRDSREVEQGSFQSEPSEQEVWNFAQEMKQRVSLLDTSDAISGPSSSTQEVSNRHLGVVGEHMLCDWYQPEKNTVWAEPKVFKKLSDLKLALEQQSSVDIGIRANQWALGKS